LLPEMLTAWLMHFTRFVTNFVTSYLPIVCPIRPTVPLRNLRLAFYKPLFLLCIFGYKLIKQTSFVELHEMDFDGGDRDDSTSDEHPPATFMERLGYMLVP
jgi:amino acid permease